MIKEQFIQVENTEKFKEQLENGEISNQSIAFLKDTNQIWTQDKYYHCDDVLDDTGKIKRELLDRAIDLSYRDINGNVLATQNTANCYVIKEPGTYKLPLVYGNAIKNGQVNTAAYTNIEPDNENMGDFVNVDGNPISSPWIEKDLGVSLSPNYNYTVAFDDVYISDGYAYFTFPPERAKSSYDMAYSFVVNKGTEITFDDVGFLEDKVAWQWTIWYFPHQLTTIDITNATGVKYQLLSENLAPGYNQVTFDFGRYSGVFDNDSQEVYNMSQLLALPPLSPSYSPWGKDGHSYFWSSGISTYYNYWNAAQNNSGVSDINVIKTVYDPCPVGFVVPPASVFSGMSLVNGFYSSSNEAVGWFTRFSGDTGGIKLWSVTNKTAGTYQANYNAVILLTSSISHFYAGSAPTYFYASNTSIDYTWYSYNAISASIRPIVEN